MNFCTKELFLTLHFEIVARGCSLRRLLKLASLKQKCIEVTI